MPSLLDLDEDPLQPPGRQPTSDSVLGLLDTANQTALGPVYVPRDPSTLVGAGAGSPFDVAAPTGGRSLPADNYRKPLSNYAPTLYRQASANEVPDYVPGMRTNDKRYDEPYFADHPDLATGQGSNAGGIMMAFDASGIHGKINQSKPSFEPSWQSGYGEYIGTKNTQQDYQRALSALRIPSDLQLSKMDAIQLMNATRRLKNAGWDSQEGPGYVEYTRPQQ